MATVLTENKNDGEYDLALIGMQRIETYRRGITNI